MAVRKKPERQRVARKRGRVTKAKKRTPSARTRGRPGVPSAVETPAIATSGPHSELERQVEELERSQVRLTASRRRYLQLFDLAPLGYVVVDRALMVRCTTKSVAYAVK